jgi:hypothetical protein
MPPALDLRANEDGDRVSIVGTDHAPPAIPKPKRKRQRVRIVREKRERVRIEPDPVSYLGTPQFDRYLMSQGIDRFDETDLDPASRAELASHHADFVRLIDADHDTFLRKQRTSEQVGVFEGSVANKWG